MGKYRDSDEYRLEKISTNKENKPPVSRSHNTSEFAKTLNIKPGKPRVLIIVPGLSTNAEWIDIAINKTESWQGKIKPIKTSAGYISHHTIFTRFGIRKYREILKDDIANIVMTHRRQRISILAHSMGTALLADVLPKISFRFHNIVFLGSICHDKHANMIRERCGLFVNDRGDRDGWPIWAQAIRPWDYSYTGTYGFRNSYSVVNRIFNNDHYDCTYTYHIEKNVVPVLDGVSPLPYEDFKSKRSITKDRLKIWIIRSSIISIIALTIFILFQISKLLMGFL